MYVRVVSLIKADGKIMRQGWAWDGGVGLGSLTLLAAYCHLAYISNVRVIHSNCFRLFNNQHEFVIIMLAWNWEGGGLIFRIEFTWLFTCLLLYLLVVAFI
jgi:hypothetical protein